MHKRGKVQFVSADGIQKNCVSMLRIYRENIEEQKYSAETKIIKY